MAFTYILECSDGTFYTGWTIDLEKRLQSHNAGKGSKYTRARLPVRLAHQEIFSSRKEAMQREYEIKQLNRKEKEDLVFKK